MPEVKEMVSNRRRLAEVAGPAAAQRPGRVLVIEDEQDVAELIRYNLAKEGLRGARRRQRGRRAQEPEREGDTDEEGH